jgi:hypothetical protein
MKMPGLMIPWMVWNVMGILTTLISGVITVAVDSDWRSSLFLAIFILGQ